MPQFANLGIYQGDDFSAVVTVLNGRDPADLTGYTAQAQIRAGVADQASEPAIQMVTSISSPNVYLSIPHTQTATLTGGYIWDLQLTHTADGIVSTILRGNVLVTQEVTRP